MWGFVAAKDCKCCYAIPGMGKVDTPAGVLDTGSKGWQTTCSAVYAARLCQLAAVLWAGSVPGGCMLGEGCQAQQALTSLNIACCVLALSMLTGRS